MKGNVEQYYDQAPEKEWERLVSVSQIEYFITKRILEQIIGSRTLRILDLGGGPGRYAIELSKKGHEVTLVDLSESNLALARHKATEASVEIRNIIQASATDLSALPRNYFNLALSLGPMYHLTNDEDLARANAELLRVLKPDTHALVSFITKLAVLRDVLARGPERIIQFADHYQNEVMKDGIIVQPPESGFTDLRLFHASEIEPLMTDAGFIFERLIGCEGPMNLRLYDSVNSLKEEEKDQIFDAILPLSEWPSLLDSSDHILFVGRKPHVNAEAILSEASLNDWNRPEEDLAWVYLQNGKP